MSRTELGPEGRSAPFGIAVGLELDATLRRIVRSGRELTNARYGMFAVFGADHELIRFVSSGADETSEPIVDEWPAGSESFETTVDSGESQRSLLCVPVRIRDSVFGQLCLADKNGHDSEPFTEQDEHVAEELAEVAGAAVENAYVHEQSRRRQRLLHAIEEISAALLAGAETMDVLHLIADRALTLSGADHVLIALPASTDGTDGDDTGGTDGDDTFDQDALKMAAKAKSLTVRVCAGHGADLLVGRRIPLDGSTAGMAFLDRVPCLVPRLDFDLTTGTDIAFGPALVVPLRSRDTAIGVLIAVRKPSATGFDDDQLPLVAAFADQAAVGLQLARHQRRLRELDVLAERERIAADLHDNVIQRLFAVGLALRGTQRRAVLPEVRRRLSENIDHVHDVITEIRNAIYDLHATGSETAQLRTSLREIVKELTENSAVHVRIDTTGPLEVLPGYLAEHAAAVIREAVSNAVRHARATELTVEVSVVDDLVINVTDNGNGIPPNAHRSGLLNLSQRAARADGQLTVDRPLSGGTRVLWTAPLPPS